MTTTAFSIDALAQLPCELQPRMDYVRAHEAELANTPPVFLDRIATLILQASPNELKKKYPIIGDQISIEDTVDVVSVESLVG